LLDVRLTKGPVRHWPLVVPVCLGTPPPPQAAPAAAAGGFTGAAGQVCLAHPPAGAMLLVGGGERLTRATAEAAGALAAAELARVPRITLDARGLRPELAAALAAGAWLRNWRPRGHRSRPEADAPRLAGIDLLVDLPPMVRRTWNRHRAALTGAGLARDLAAEPGNVLTPAAFCARLGLLSRHGLTLRVLDAAELRRQGLGALLAVGGGSAHPPFLAVLSWGGDSDAAPLAFVGKGITFDTGGLCLKPADRLWEMRADMAGAAACAGAVLALALRRSTMPAVAVLALAENAIGAAAYRPGDVLRSFAGTTIEVVDTDAEGRLILADALAWTVAHVRPRAIVDVATLTGSIVTALGHNMAGLFDNDATLAAQVAAAGAAVEEPAWRMPIGAAHRRDLASDIADLRHCVPGPLQPDASHAAAFLREFVDDTPWAHLDIAGVEQRQEASARHAAGPSGFGVRLLDRLAAQAFEPRGVREDA
jgi:leucyl aminopeptidase